MSHEWNVKTAYYTAKVPIWVDEIPDIEEWREEFMKAEAKEVVEAVGAWIYCFHVSQSEAADGSVEEAMKAIQAVVEEHVGYGSDTVMLAVAASRARDKTGMAEEEKGRLEDVSIQCGFELVDYAAQGQNEIGERQGFERLKEALEANDWMTTDDDDEGSLGDLEPDDGDSIGGIGHAEAETTAELYGMKAALMADEDHELDGDDSMSAEEQKAEVDDLDVMMGKLMAVKEQSAGFPDAQRKKMAARAVRRLMEDVS